MSRYFASIICCFLLVSLSSSFAQVIIHDDKAYEILKNRGEVYFSFTIPAACSLNWLSNQLSIDRIKDDTIFAYANEQEFENFLKLKIKYALHTAPSLVAGLVPLMKTTSDLSELSYPSYNQYIEMMENFATTYPDLCKVIEIGTSIGGKRIFAVKISDNVHEEETEPRVFYSSTMHGDEPSGLVLMLRFIDHLLYNYSENEKITFLVNNSEVYINPLANPDGLYFLSDTSITGAKRGNLNNIDLNRDFPDPENGTKDVLQPETQCMIDFMKDRKFILSANFHGGAEVLNFPWDRWERRHADNVWYISISRAYADTVHHYAEAGYMTGFDNGITNGYDWYQVSHGRQDYVNYYLHGREITIELSEEKIPAENDLNRLWEYNKRSLVNYLLNSFQGVRGSIRDSNSGIPLKARIFINNHDRDNSHVYSDSATGIFYRMLAPGNYQLIISSPGYIPEHIEVTITENSLVDLDLSLVSSGPGIIAYPNPFADNLYLYFSELLFDNAVITISDLSRRIFINKTIELAGNDLIKLETSHLCYGIYVVHVYSDKMNRSIKIMKVPFHE